MKLTQDSLMSSFTSQSKIRCLEVKKKKRKGIHLVSLLKISPKNVKILGLQNLIPMHAVLVKLYMVFWHCFNEVVYVTGFFFGVFFLMSDRFI